jgi:serine phosphatase RsbU (regulator of sigma subunit)
MTEKDTYSEAHIRHVNHLTEELENFKEIAVRLKPDAGEIPKLPGIDVFGATIPLAGAIGGDHIIYIDFKQRHDLDARIAQAQKKDLSQIARNLEGLKQTAAVLLADVSGHRITDAALAGMLHQAFLLGVLYELELYGTVTTKLFENINNRFYRSSAVNKFVTMIYGEIHVNGTFRFMSAGHPPPLVFSNEFDRFMEIHPDLLISYPPIGTMPSQTDPDRSCERSALGYKGKYTINELKLMMPGDILLLYTDGLMEHGGESSGYFPGRLEAKIREFKNERARRILEEVSRDLLAFATPEDDVSCVVIKKN